MGGAGRVWWAGGRVGRGGAGRGGGLGWGGGGGGGGDDCRHKEKRRQAKPDLGEWTQQETKSSSKALFRRTDV